MPMGLKIRSTYIVSYWGERVRGIKSVLSTLNEWTAREDEKFVAEMHKSRQTTGFENLRGLRMIPPFCTEYITCNSLAEINPLNDELRHF